jgi:hypothetical protein
MVGLDIIAIFLSSLSLVIAIIALFINWKKFVRDKPKIEALVVNGLYQNLENTQLSIDVTIQFINKGQAPGSVTDIKAFVRYSERVFKIYPPLKYKFDRFTHFVRPYEVSKHFPILIEANGAKNKELRFNFDNIVINYVDRGIMPINLKEPKKWEWKDLPILIKFMVDSSSGIIEFETFVFRYDQEESRRERGTIDYEYYDERKDDFAPKIDFDE